ncbi:unnamed protein product [Rotaria socialis]|uniref:Uncharacterized protein n=3 Tax=Rotaria socialis TaxID=392032 RepID=A0A821E009_9BILA|nr:unnamed protein product [Rotaria socialis]
MMMMMINPVLITNDRYSSNKIAWNKEQVIAAVMIAEQWNHGQRCRLIERLLPSCTPAQLDMLGTVLQPSLHRDYFYAVKSRYPNYHFKRISTPESRSIKEYHQRCFDREESFYLSTINDLQEFRDDDGIRRKSQSSFGQIGEPSNLFKRSLET